MFTLYYRKLPYIYTEVVKNQSDVASTNAAKHVSSETLGPSSNIRIQLTDSTPYCRIEICIFIMFTTMTTVLLMHGYTATDAIT